MKSTLRPTSPFKNYLITLALPLLAALAFASPLSAQSAADTDVGDAKAARGGTLSPDQALPGNLQKKVAVMVEMNAVPAAVPYAAAYQQAQAQADAARNYALAHPTLKTSKALLSQAKPPAIQISAAAAQQVSNTVHQLDSAQRALLPNLTGADIGGTVIYRAQRAYNGVAMLVSPDKISAIEAMPGVKAVHPMVPKHQAVAFSSVDFIGGRSFWTKAPFGIHGENIKVGDIDTGLDYIHTDFGGPGSGGYAAVPDHTVAPNPYFPTQKVPGGYDFAGDNYAATASGTEPSNIPHPDPDPFDCGGHGTGTASLIAGYGVTNAGFTYAGSYDGANPSMANLSISPGMAPSAKIYPLRVFGCGGSTNLVVQAIEWAMDPNGDGDFSDHLDVINMSLGSPEGFADDSDAVAASNAASIGILVCSAAGNNGDTFYVHSAPAAAAGTLSVAASYNDQNGFISDASVTGNSANLAGQKFAAIYADTSPHTSATGDVVYAKPADGSTPFTNAAQVAGHIVLIDRGNVTFATKAANAQAAGAIGIIVANTLNRDPAGQGSTGSLSVPDVMISTADGNTIKTAAAFDANGVPANPTNVTIAPDAITIVKSTNPPGSAAGAGSPDTVPSYTSRGPGLPGTGLKPDLTAPAEVVGVALKLTGNKSENFNGTSSATPHVAGSMALLKQMHPTWSVQELNAAICDTATHDIATTVGGATKLGPGRVGAGRVDLTNASNANVVAYNGTDPNLIGVSFGAVEVPVDGSKTLTKAIKVTNKGASSVTYNITYLDNVAASGTSFTLPASVTVAPGSSSTFNVTFTATGSALRHERDLSTTTTFPTSFGTFSRQYLTEKAGYAVLTPTSGTEPTIRVALYAAPKPISAMHTTIASYVPDADNGTVPLNLSGVGINTGVSFPTDIVSYVHAFELQYASPDANAINGPTSPNVIKYVGISTDWANRTQAQRDSFSPFVNIAIEGFGNAAMPDSAASDKEIFFELNPNPNADFNPSAAIFLNSLHNGNDPTNVYFLTLVDFTGSILGAPGSAPWEPVNARSTAATSRDTNSFNNSLTTIPIDGLVGTGSTSIRYQVVTFDRNNNQVDQSPVLFFDAANPGIDTIPAAPQLEPYFLNDLPTTTLPVTYNGANFQTDGSIGVMVAHMHNGSGNRTDVVAFKKPLITSFSPTSGKVGAQITITGANFGPGTKVTFFSNKPASSVNVISPTTLVATVPPGAISGPIRVSNAAGFSSKGGFTVLP